MSIYSNTQICGTDNKITFRKHPNDPRVVFVAVDTNGQRICMDATHIRALAFALDAWEDAENGKAFDVEMAK